MQGQATDGPPPQLRPLPVAATSPHIPPAPASDLTTPPPLKKLRVPASTTALGPISEGHGDDADAQGSESVGPLACVGTDNGNVSSTDSHAVAKGGHASTGDPASTGGHARTGDHASTGDHARTGGSASAIKGLASPGGSPANTGNGYAAYAPAVASSESGSPLIPVWHSDGTPIIMPVAGSCCLGHCGWVKFCPEFVSRFVWHSSVAQ